MTLDLTLYGRPDCCLCDAAARLLAELRSQLDFHLTEVDIEQDDALHRRYLERIPVLTMRDQVGETVLAELDEFSLNVLKTLLAKVAEQRHAAI